MKVAIGTDTSIWFDIDGQGLIADGDAMRPRPTLVLMHGGPGGDHNTFKPAFGAMTDTCQVLYYDHRGQGRSDWSTPDTWTLDQWADDAVSLCETLGIDKPFILGLSFGGFVAQRLASRHPGFARGIILNSTRSDHDRSAMFDMFEQLGGAEARDVALEFWNAPDEATMAKMARRYVKVCGPLYTQNNVNPFAGQRTVRNDDVLTHFNHHEGAALNLLPELAKVNDPVLVMAGDLDPVTPVIDARRMAAAMPQQFVRFESFANSGHGIYRDEPERYFEVLKSFINEHWTS